MHNQKMITPNRREQAIKEMADLNIVGVEIKSEIPKSESHHFHVLMIKSERGEIKNTLKFRVHPQIFNSKSYNLFKVDVKNDPDVDVILYHDGEVAENLDRKEAAEAKEAKAEADKKAEIVANTEREENEKRTKAAEEKAADLQAKLDEEKAKTKEAESKAKEAEAKAKEAEKDKAKAEAMLDKANKKEEGPKKS